MLSSTKVEMKRANKVCWFKKSENFLKPKLTSELAEFVGIMLGDGYISYPKTPRIKISFNSRDDKEYLRYVYRLLTRLFKTKLKIEERKNENTANIYLFKRDIIRLIIHEIGLNPSPKWDRAKIPEWIFENNLERDVLRGYFDTDGCVVMTKNNGTLYPRLEMKICPSPMQGQFIKILDGLGFHFGVYKIGKGEVRVQMNGKVELKKWSKQIGFHNAKHQKKSELFLNKH